MGIGHDDEGVAQHGAKDGLARSVIATGATTGRVTPDVPSVYNPMRPSMATERSPISETLVRVNYSETDQMGVVYHARYLVWLDVARTEHLRRSGMSYRELEAVRAAAGRQRGGRAVSAAGPL